MQPIDFPEINLTHQQRTGGWGEDSQFIIIHWLMTFLVSYKSCFPLPLRTHMCPYETISMILDTYKPMLCRQNIQILSAYLSAALTPVN